MAVLRGRRKAALAVALGVIGAGTAGTVAIAGGTPANKMMAAGSKTQVVGPGESVTILSGIMRTSKPKDVIMQVALECSILQSLTTDDTTPSSRAENTVRVWVEVDDRIVPITDVSTPPQDPATPTHTGNDSDKVTFCDRTYQRTVTDSETLLDGIDTQEDFLNTKSSHGFNWVRLDMGSGVHKIEVVAEFTEGTSGNATAEAIIGNRTLIAEPGHFDSDATIAEVGSQ